MTAWTVYRQALSHTFRLWRLVLVLWAINLLLTTVAVAPAAAALQKALASSLPAHRMQSILSASLAVDVAGNIGKDAGLSVATTFAVTALLAILIDVLTVGGVFGRLEAEERGGDGLSVFAGFFADSGRFAWRSIRLALWGALLTLGAFIILGLARKGINVFAKHELYQGPVLWLELIRSILAVGLLVTVRAMVDGARAAMFVEEKRVTRHALRDGIRLVTRTPGPALGGYALAGGTLIAVAAVAFLIKLQIPQAGWGGFVVATLFGQLTVLFKLAGAVATSAVSLLAWQESANRIERSSMNAFDNQPDLMPSSVRTTWPPVGES